MSVKTRSANKLAILSDTTKFLAQNSLILQTLTAFAMRLDKNNVFLHGIYKNL